MICEELPDKIVRLKELYETAERVVFFGGAGVSTESGIPDFRSEDGLYRQKYAFPPEVILSHTFFEENPKEFFRFYFDKMIYTDAKPNAAHLFLAEEEKKGKISSVITQNIDGLHQAAGSKRVYELHGSVHRNTCLRCGKKFTLADMPKQKGGVPRCGCGGVIKPDVVLYEESLDGETIEAAVREISECDLLIVGGTSLNVYPAAGFVRFAKGKTVLVNLTETPFDKEADLAIRAPIGKTFSALKNELARDKR